MVVGVVWLVWIAVRPSAAERLASDISVNGFRKASTEVTSHGFFDDSTTVTYWVGPVGTNVRAMVSLRDLEWSESPPAGHVGSSYSGLGYGFAGDGYAIVRAGRLRCSAFIDKLDPDYWGASGRSFPGNAIDLTKDETDGVRDGRLTVLAVGVNCQ